MFAQNPTHPGLLATGAGTQDRHLRFFNTTTGELGLSCLSLLGVAMSPMYSFSVGCRRVHERH